MFPFSLATELTTERLLLRPWTRGEVADVLADRRSPRWARDFPAEGDRVIAGVIAEQIAGAPEGSGSPDRPGSPDGSGDPADPGAHGHRLIVERESGLVVGSLSLLWPPSEGSVEIGYGVVASRRGRGYASEAARALVAHALTSPDVTTVYAEVELANPASLRVLEKAGLHRWSDDGATARFRATAAPKPPRP
ncbi:GNAT family N-acetyltransferase [Streptomyces sp. WAC 01529]|uniref:GNAT family N-acetyltransferase n=1 Tax=Streptomyces sp. WAC 01529 TaxID=2203205 RepID=UPI001F0C2DFF|nr:GNAT family N-acetyltransferase [Streptomyces sp. WAC 01529]